MAAAEVAEACSQGQYTVVAEEEACSRGPYTLVAEEEACSRGPYKGWASLVGNQDQ